MARMMRQNYRHKEKHVDAQPYGKFTGGGGGHKGYNLNVYLVTLLGNNV